MVGLAVLIASLVRWYWRPAQWLDRPGLDPFWSIPQVGFVFSLLAITAVALMVLAYCRSWQYGWIRPVGTKWWLLLPLAILFGMTGAVWIPLEVVRQLGWMQALILYALALPVSAELLFRSLAHGLLTQDARIQRYDTRWFISWPMLGSALLYSGFVFGLNLLAGTGPQQAAQWQMIVVPVAAAGFGLTQGMVRERSQSLFPAILFHILAAAAAMVFVRIF